MSHDGLSTLERLAFAPRLVTEQSEYGGERTNRPLERPSDTRAGGRRGADPGAVTQNKTEPASRRRRLGPWLCLVHESSSEDGAQGLAIRRFSGPGTLALAGEGCRVELHSMSVSCLDLLAAQRSDIAHIAFRHERRSWLGGVSEA